MSSTKISPAPHPLDGSAWQDTLTKKKALALVAYHSDRARANATALDAIAAAVQDAYARGRKDQEDRGWRHARDEPWDPR